MRTIFLVAICLFLLSFAFGQNVQISGYVKDIDTGETLIGATVHHPASETTSVTNEYGFYSVRIPEGDARLLFSYIGYVDKDTTLTVSQNTELQVNLLNEQNQIEEVVITVDEQDEKIQTAAMSVNKLSSEQIKQIPVVLGEVDLVKSIQLLPGVVSNGEASNGFNVRGGSEDQNLVLLDEAVIYNSAHVLGFFSVFNNDAIKDVKLYKGGIPARFGGRISSVLDVRQKDGNDQELKVTGGLGLISSRLMLEGPIKKDKASFLVAGRSSYVDLFLKAADNPNSLNFYDLNTKLNWDITDKDQLYLSGYFGNDRFALSDFFENSYGNETANLRWNHVYTNNLFSNLSAIYSRYRYNLDFAALDFKWESGIKNLNVKYDFDWFASQNLTVKFGAGAIGYEFNPGEIFPTTDESSINYEQLQQKNAIEGGLYAHFDHQLTDRFVAEYGLRYSSFYRLGGQTINEYANNQPVLYDTELAIYKSADANGETAHHSSDVIADFHTLEPRLSLSYQLNDNQAVKATYNRTAQYIHLISNTATPTPFDIWAPSGPFLEPQIGDQYGLGYFRNFNDKRYSLEVEAYYKEVENRLDYIDGAELIGNDAIESVTLPGEVDAHGAELLLRKNEGNLQGWLAYTYSKAEQTTKGGTAGGPGINEGQTYFTNYDRTHDISLTSAYELNDRWSFAGNFIYQTGRPVTYPRAQYTYQDLTVASYGLRNAERLPDYHRLDISATLRAKKNKNRKLNSEWVFAIYNAYDRRNANSITFRENADTGETEAVKLTVFGIIPSATWNFTF